MKRLILAVLLAVLTALAPVVTQAAGTVVPTSTDHVSGQDVTVYTYTLTGDASDGSFPATASEPINGWIIRVETNPGATTPTAGWGLTLVSNEADVLKGVLAPGVPSATTTTTVEAPQPYIRGAVTITPTGNSVNSAVVVLRITVLR